MRTQAIAEKLVQELKLERQKLPIRFTFIDTEEIKNVYVEVRDRRQDELFEKEVRGTLGGGGGRCRCCEGTGRERP
ncbi:MAG: hypothetical protein K2Y32_23485 [Candidatus Obscuribacterales bacterium]|nr:hypothetical protein [Candidatus Obscuribacterales bacterium]